MIELRRAGYNTDLSAPLDNIPFSSSAERERVEENVCMQYLCNRNVNFFFPFPNPIIFRVETNCNAQVFRNKLTFFAAAKVSSSFPTPDLPEIAFAGMYSKFCTCLAI